ncbi:hypothetical protein B0H16DRAFT_1451420 [Mycena metata]|uniref:Bacteriophage T5 Orf172 DNA-binding domain-containing protein n=1 Tax=Mycena metata TaxID=1033252 RepID=A0AAD7NRP8_9AGAR|nr:hypothetical protein B0H16DRAFT_1451420 [Mycena metata]
MREEEAVQHQTPRPLRLGPSLRIQFSSENLAKKGEKEDVPLIVVVKTHGPGGANALIDLYESANAYDCVRSRVASSTVVRKFPARFPSPLDAAVPGRSILLSRMARIIRPSPAPLLQRLRALRRTSIAKSPDVPDPFTRVHVVLARHAYKREGEGNLYVTARIDEKIQQDYEAERIPLETFLDQLEVKLGHTKAMKARQRQYKKCAKKQHLIWHHYYRADRRMLAERMIQLTLDALGAQRAIRACPGCGVRHREYYSFRSIGSYERLHRIIVSCLEALGQKKIEKITLPEESSGIIKQRIRRVKYLSVLPSSFEYDSGCCSNASGDGANCRQGKREGRNCGEIKKWETSTASGNMASAKFTTGLSETSSRYAGGPKQWVVEDVGHIAHRPWERDVRTSTARYGESSKVKSSPGGCAKPQDMRYGAVRAVRYGRGVVGWLRRDVDATESKQAVDRPTGGR